MNPIFYLSLDNLLRFIHTCQPRWLKLRPLVLKVCLFLFPQSSVFALVDLEYLLVSLRETIDVSDGMLFGE